MFLLMAHLGSAPFFWQAIRLQWQSELGLERDELESKVHRVTGER
jgi:hypothetical protein